MYVRVCEFNVIQWYGRLYEVTDEFACESEKWKQTHLMKNVLAENACLFSDVTCIADDDSRTCVRHNRACVSW